MRTKGEVARRRLLTTLANYEDWREEAEAKVAAEAAAGVVQLRTGRVPLVGMYPTHTPLWAGDWTSGREIIRIAAREAAALGDIEYHDAGHPNGPMVRITEQGRHAIGRGRPQPESAVGR